MFLTDTEISSDCLLQLKELSSQLKDAAYRSKLETSMIHSLSDLLGVCQSKLAANIIDADVEIVAECFRSLRNACAGCLQNQDAVRDLDVFSKVHGIFSHCLKELKKDADHSQGNSVIPCLRCGVQFLGNASTGNVQNQDAVWNTHCTLFRKLLNLQDAALGSYTCMVIYTCLTPARAKFLTATAEGVDISVAVAEHLAKEDTEWGLYILENLLESPNSIMSIYCHLDDRERLIILELIDTKLKTIGEESSMERRDLQQPVSPQTIEDLSVEFKNKAHSILGLSREEDVDTMEPELVLKKLDILCCITKVPNYCPSVQKDIDLIKCAINLMHCVRMIGNQGDNAFAALSKAADSGSADPQHPVYGLKKDLIRLLANMAYKNKENQDQIREAGGMHLIMDHTKIDARNPYIMQWAIFAIHNLCEGNEENQQVVSNMKLEGVADNVHLLKEFGIQAEMEGDKIVVKQVDKTVSPFDKPKGKDK